MKSLTKKYEYQAPMEDVWNAFTNMDYMKYWDAGPCEMTENEGEDFKLWAGDIWGTNTKIEKYKFIEQDWYAGDWDEPSKVSLNFSDGEGKVIVELKHENIPDDEFEDVDKGWDDFYLGAIAHFLNDKKLGKYPNL